MPATISPSTAAPPVTPLDPKTAIFNSRRVRRATVGGEMFYAAVDVVARLGDGESASRTWSRLRGLLGLTPARVAFDDPGADGPAEPLEALTKPETLRLAAAVESPAGRRVAAWLAEAAIRGEAVAKRDVYARRPRRWAERRQAAKRPRQELAGEWHARGVTSPPQFRELTNALFAETFGLDVAAYRRHKGLPQAAKLRDHMTATELTLVSLAESVASDLLRRRNAYGYEAVLEATRDAGRAASAARVAVEAQFGQAAVSAANHVVRAAA